MKGYGHKVSHQVDLLRQQFALPMVHIYLKIATAIHQLQTKVPEMLMEGLIIVGFFRL